jgi:hypothetical protein
MVDYSNMIPMAGMGGIGWWVTNFLLIPTRRISDLRRAAHEQVTFCASIGKDSPAADRDAARLALRRVAAALVAEAESAAPLTRWWISRRGWDLLGAGQQLLATANTFDQETEPNLAIIARDSLDRALRLRPRR